MHGAHARARGVDRHGAGSRRARDRGRSHADRSPGFCYELRQAALAGSERSSGSRVLAAHEEVESFYAHLEKTMVEIGFLNPEHPKKLMQRLRRLFSRAQLEKEEVHILRGIVKALTQRKAGPRKSG